MDLLYFVSLGSMDWSRLDLLYFVSLGSMDWSRLDLHSFVVVKMTPWSSILAMGGLGAKIGKVAWGRKKNEGFCKVAIWLYVGKALFSGATRGSECWQNKSIGFSHVSLQPTFHAGVLARFRRHPL